ncbi:MAG: hypothetical protein PHT02_01210 [Tissierellia bacterium]|nr:hypothetical protein [Tissierellia bacterium]
MDNNFKQLCVWQGFALGNHSIADFEEHMKNTFDVKIKFAEEVETNGSEARNEEGGRHDLLFYIHDEDISKFAVKRLAYGIRWWEDVVLYNDGAYLYNQEILDKYSVKW